MRRTAAIIVAAGLGTRAGGDLPKQWRSLGGRRVLDRAVEAFQRAPSVSRIVLVLHPQDLGRAKELSGLQVIPGGDSRSASVRAGLHVLADAGVEYVLIHDAARPLVSQRIIADVIEALQHVPAAAPAVEVTDALWRGADGLVTGIQDRRGLFRAQTPQGFHFTAIRDAHAASTGAPADDVEVALAAGLPVKMVPGEERNLKLTHAADFDRAEAFLRGSMDIRLGNGFDVHRFGDGDRVTLCGVEIPFHRGLSGHSDADVGMHAVTDAIYGALAMGDIGRHFPPSDEKWKGAASAIFLRHAMDLAASRGYAVSNVDLTLICELPKIGPHAADMTRKMADVMRLEPDRISIKATTSERLGFTGREEGIAALATACLSAA